MKKIIDFTDSCCLSKISILWPSNGKYLHEIFASPLLLDYVANITVSGALGSVQPLKTLIPHTFGTTLEVTVFIHEHVSDPAAREALFRSMTEEHLSENQDLIP